MLDAYTSIQPQTVSWEEFMSDNDVNDHNEELAGNADKLTPADIDSMVETIKGRTKAPRGPFRPDETPPITEAEQPEITVEKANGPDWARPRFTRNTNLRLEEDAHRRLLEFVKVNHLPSVSAAIRVLVLRGLDSEGIE